VIAVACGAVVLIPSLALLFSLYLRGRLDTPEHPAPEDHVPLVASSFPAEGAGGAAERPGTASSTVRVWGGAAGLGLVAGSGLLVFADASWAHLLGVACLVLCAISVFRLTATD
jgi:cytochrome bd ubiquinol oxidase subunit II